MKQFKLFNKNTISLNKTTMLLKYYQTLFDFNLFQSEIHAYFMIIQVFLWLFLRIKYDF